MKGLIKILNKAILCGRLTKDPEARETANSEVCNFTVAIPRKYVKQGEQRQSDFINCVAFGKTSTFISTYFKKGSMISIDGSIQTRTWEDNEGKKRYVTEVIVNDAGFVESKKDSGAAEGQALPGLPEEFGEVPKDDDLPF